MKRLALIVFVALPLFLFGQGQTIVTKLIDQYSDRSSSADPNDLFLIEDNAHANYWNQTRSSLNAQFVQQIPNQWPGPSANVDFNVANHNNGELYYVASGAVTVSGFANKGTTVQTVTLSILATGGNQTFTMPASVLSRDGLRSYTLTNNQVFIISFRYHPGLNVTNSVNCPNF